jgi:hypothetical protein
MKNDGMAIGEKAASDGRSGFVKAAYQNAYFFTHMGQVLMRSRPDLWWAKQETNGQARNLPVVLMISR